MVSIRKQSPALGSAGALRPVLAALCIGLSLSACKLSLGADGQTESRALAAARPVAGPGGTPPKAMDVAGGSITIFGPRGFCIDRAASSARSDDQAVVVLSSCRDLGAGFLTPAPATPAILTAAVASADVTLDLPAAAPALQRLFASDDGRALLSRSGSARSVTVHEAFGAEDAFLLRLTDTSPFPGGNVGADYWRAIFVVDGRAITVSAYSAPGEALQRNDGIRLLREFILAIRAASSEA